MSVTQARILDPFHHLYLSSSADNVTSIDQREHATASPLWLCLLFAFPLLLIIKSLWAIASRRTNAWLYLLRGPAIIQSKFEQAQGKSFEVLAPDNRYVFVSSKEQIKELDSTPDDVLSLQAASKQMLQPKYTMHGFNWFDQRGTEGVGFVRALRTLLTNNLPQILSDLSLTIRSRFAEMHADHPVIAGRRETPVYHTILKLVVLSNAISFFGKDLANMEHFMESALSYIEETLICAEVVRLVPKAMAPLIGGLIASSLKSHGILYRTLLAEARERFEEGSRTARTTDARKPDCITWIMETSPKNKPWTPERVVHELMAIWFGSVHALSTTITFAIHDLCLHPEYVQPLRNELHAEYAAFEQKGTGLALLDSFIKESARLTPVESMSTRRHALKPFTMLDGTHINVGDWLCTPVKAIMQDPRYYPQPLDFHGFRFVDRTKLEQLAMGKMALSVQQSNPTSLTDFDNSWHVWGTGRMVCPGRFYAAAVMKVILGQLIMHYNFDMLPQKGSRYFSWRSSVLPSDKTRIVFTPILES